MTSTKTMPYDPLLKKALEFLTEASQLKPEETNDMRDLGRLWDLEDQATKLIESYDLMYGVSAT